MFKPLSTFIGLRYTRAKRDNHFVSFISAASVLGIVLGVMVLITVLSVINGYEQGMRDRYLGMLSHVTVSEAGWQLPDWQQRKQQVLQTPGVKAAAPFIEKQVMLKEGLNVRGALLQAVLPEQEKLIGTVGRYIAKPAQFSDLKPGENNIILGETLAKKLGVKRGDTLTLLSPKPTQGFDSGEQQIPLLKEFNVVGTFKVDMQQYDSTTAYIHLDDARDLFEMGDLVTGLRVQLDDLYQAPQISEAIAANSTGDYIITNWTTSNQNFFKAIQLQKTMLFLVLVLIIAIAAFNLVSTLIMVVTDKESDIAILRTLGMSPAQVMRVFIVQGSVLGVIGTLLGVVLGLLLASNVGTIVPWLEHLFNTHFLQAEVHGITHVDAKIETLDVLLIALSALLLSVLATLFPAWKASRVQPAESLRYE